eukprot:TRINITY_DN39802_c0_g1_i1.p1 TRINITY_DN39802_c0_g1~~TRINITY_DN39802_c0_g1_i1.p1  ORF type:complete len:803 (+),score=146.57 TRINITY_DN39802_c0_g1_i1:335-2410(+)
MDQCPAAHPLQRAAVELPTLCCRCNVEFSRGFVYCCRQCDFDVCEDCAARQPGTPSTPSTESLAASSDMQSSSSVLAEADMSNGAWIVEQCSQMMQMGQVWWCWPLIGQGWEDPSGMIAPPVLFDTTLGPVHHLHEPPCAAEGADEKEEVSTACSESHIDGDSDVVEREGRPYPVFTCRQTSAVAGIVDVVEFMRTAALARYAARARFFDLVREAAAAAIGPHFERLALVGSTALRIDTPDSDLDVVAFTRPNDGVPAPAPVESLRRIAQVLCTRDASLKLQLVECSRVPVLTAVSADGILSLDLTVDQPLGERHVLWFQSLWEKADSSNAPAPLHSVPEPVDADGDSWELGLEAAVLRCVKWWLRRRRIPVSKEGGYPTVVWTLMVLHVLRTSLTSVREGSGKEDMGRKILSAIAAFFEHFVKHRCSGTLVFSTGADGMHSEFRPLASQDNAKHCETAYGELSVLDPTTTSEESAAAGVSPSELATPLSFATRLLHAYELRRAQRLTAMALAASGEGPLPCGEVRAPSAASGGKALQALFAAVGEAPNTLPSALPFEQSAVFVLRDGWLQVGLLKQVAPKSGWCAPFLHRRDLQSAIAVELCNVDVDGTLTPRHAPEQWYYACDFVCMANLHPPEHSSKKAWHSQTWCLDEESLERWQGMKSILIAGNRKNSYSMLQHRAVWGERAPGFR